MSKYVITGGNRLNGEVNIQGAKNSALPILAAALLINGTTVLHNCPNLSDTRAALEILKALGCSCVQNENDIYINSSSLSCSKIPADLMLKMRSSVVFLGAILSRCSVATITAPGGCELGPRPIDLHLKAIKELGFSVCDTGEIITCKRESPIKNVEISLDFPSVGATENVILASCVSGGRVSLCNAAKEPEIVDLANFINKAGGRVQGAGTDQIEIIGVKRLYSVEHTVIPDRIVAATFMSAAAVTGGEIFLKNVCPNHLIAVMAAFREMGCNIKWTENSLLIKAESPLKRIKTLRSTVYSGFPTDAGPLLVASLIKAQGTSVFIENIFENRFNYIGELRRLSADIKVFGKVAVIEGVKTLNGANLSCTDLRGGAAAVIAALGANGQSKIDNIFHIERGYEALPETLGNLSAIIKKE